MVVSTTMNGSLKSLSLPRFFQTKTKVKTKKRLRCALWDYRLMSGLVKLIWHLETIQKLLFSCYVWNRLATRRWGFLRQSATRGAHLSSRAESEMCQLLGDWTCTPRGAQKLGHARSLRYSSFRVLFSFLPRFDSRLLRSVRNWLQRASSSYFTPLNLWLIINTLKTSKTLENSL